MAACEEHPKQDWLLSGIYDRPTEEERDLDVAHFQRVARTEGFDRLFKDKRLDIVAFSMDSLAFALASAASELVSVLILLAAHTFSPQAVLSLQYHKVFSSTTEDLSDWALWPNLAVKI